MMTPTVHSFSHMGQKSSRMCACVVIMKRSNSNYGSSGHNIIKWYYINYFLLLCTLFDICIYLISLYQIGQGECTNNNVVCILTPYNHHLMQSASFKYTNTFDSGTKKNIYQSQKKKNEMGTDHKKEYNNKKSEC